MTMRITIPLFFRGRTQTFCLTLRRTNGSFILGCFDRLVCVMMKLYGPPHDHSWKHCRAKREVAGVGRPVRGRVRDGDGGTELSEVQL